MEPICSNPEIAASHEERAKARKTNLALATTMMGFALLLLVWLIPSYVIDYATGEKGLSPRFFPYLIAGCLGLLATVLFYQTIHSGPGPETCDQKQKIDRYNILGIATFFVYYFGVIILGLAPASFLALLALTRLFGLRSWPKALMFSAILVSLLFVFFEEVAQVPMPRGVFFDGLY